MEIDGSEQVRRRCEVCDASVWKDEDETEPEGGWRCETCEPLKAKQIEERRADRMPFDPRLSRKNNDIAVLARTFDVSKKTAGQRLGVKLVEPAYSRREWPEWARNNAFAAFLAVDGSRNSHLMTLRYELLRLSVRGCFTTDIVKELGAELGEKKLRTQKDRDTWRFLPKEGKDDATRKYRRVRVDSILNSLRKRGDALWPEFVTNPAVARNSMDKALRCLGVVKSRQASSPKSPSEIDVQGVLDSILRDLTHAESNVYATITMN